MYQALYNKWRPQTFSEVAGQAGVTETLLRQSAAGRLSHAYLFIGTRGTGKTTCAKLLARAANCENPQNGEPCNVCSTCLSIINGANSDVLEIDAASNSGVENMRALREQTAYMPVEARLRVYIIDECHMLTGAAFNALLKTLEEPPPHVLFILATTELHKVPATILSRCQRFAFRRLDAGTLVKRLMEIAAAEGIDLTERGARLISRLSDGGMRDAISMLDQCHGAVKGSIDEAGITDALGLFGAADMLEVLASVSNGDAAGALATLNRAYSDGTDAAVFLSELATTIRDVLILQTTGNSALLVGGATADALTSLGIDARRAVAMLENIRETQSTLYRSMSKRLDVEICLIRLAAAQDAPAPSKQSAAQTLPSTRRAPSAHEAAAAPVSEVPLAENAEALPAAAAGDKVPPPPEDDPDDIPWELPDEPEARAESPNHSSGHPPEPTPEPPGVSDGTKPPRTETQAVSEGSSDIAHNWGAILRTLGGTLGASEYHIVAKLPHRLEENRLTLTAATMMTKSRLDTAATRETIEKAASSVLGRNIIVAIELAVKEQDEGLGKLAGLGERFDNFTIE